MLDKFFLKYEEREGVGGQIDLLHRKNSLKKPNLIRVKCSEKPNHFLFNTNSIPLLVLAHVTCFLNFDKL